jgi:hydrogenase expression/formation protein HypC
MCLAVPGKITEMHDAGGVTMGKIDFGGIAREACLAYLPEAQIGDYVLIHAGFAITRLDEEEAARTLEYLKELGEIEELERGAEPEPEPGPSQ